MHYKNNDKQTTCMSNQQKIIVGISIGDLNGIGSEIILRTFQDQRMLEFCTPVIFASVKLMSFFKKQYDLQVNLHGIDHLDKIIPKKINVLNLWKEPLQIEFGKQDPDLGSYSVQSLEAAVTIEKGSITVNGVSLTVVDSRESTFSVAIIPYTYEHTNFNTFEKDTLVNLEFDVIGKYVKRITQGYL